MSEYQYIVPLTGDLTYGREFLGGKGHHLQLLAHANFQIPGGFVLTTRAFRRVIRETVKREKVWGGLDRIETAVRETRLPAAIESELLRAARALRTLTGGALVVRSSATSEDTARSSMAGQAASFVNIRTEAALLDAVRGCWASLFSREGITYRSTLPGVDALPEMAVVVQQLVPAERAGVLFTVDPVSGDSARFLVSATWGLGETVVSGRAADTIYIDRQSGQILKEEIATKSEMRIPDARGGTQVAPVGADADRAVVSESFARQLWEVGCRVERAFDGPQDVEWAQWQGRLYLLQLRPVTTTRRAATRSVWSNTNVGEALPGVGTPFTWSFIRDFSRQGLVHAFRGLGCRVPAHYAIVGQVRGRVYLNLSEFMSVASQIPYVTPEMLERLAGGGGSEELAGTYRKLRPTGFLARFPVTAVETLMARAVTPARVALWSQRYRKFSQAFAATRFDSLSSQDLLDRWRASDAIFNDTGTLTLECSGQFLMDYMVISLLVRALYGADAPRVERDLFSGLSGIRSAEPGLDLLRMARRVADMPELVEGIRSTPPGELVSTLARGGAAEQSLHSAVEAFLRSHGHRAAREAELSEPRWREDPAFPLAMLARYLESDELPDPEAMVQRRTARREEVTGRVAARVPRPVRPLFLRLLRQAQEAARLREEMRNYVVHTLGFFRVLALETGRRMVEAGLLHDIDDVFFLTRPEQLDWLAGRGHHEQLPLRVAMRRLEHEALESLPDPPPWFVMEGDRILSPLPQVVSDRELAGLAGSPGIATGRVAVVRSPQEHGKVRHGDVLVAPFTDVGWTPLFLVASAVVTELGGPLSHSCVVAREYGVPAVVNVKDAASVLKDGDLVTVDGDRGVVVI